MTPTQRCKGERVDVVGYPLGVSRRKQKTWTGGTAKKKGGGGGWGGGVGGGMGGGVGGGRCQPARFFEQMVPGKK